VRRVRSCRLSSTSSRRRSQWRERRLTAFLDFASAHRSTSRSRN
jgi:hypothetical protein